LPGRARRFPATGRARREIKRKGDRKAGRREEEEDRRPRRFTRLRNPFGTPNLPLSIVLAADVVLSV